MKIRKTEVYFRKKLAKFDTQLICYADFSIKVIFWIELLVKVTQETSKFTKRDKRAFILSVVEGVVLI